MFRLAAFLCLLAATTDAVNVNKEAKAVDLENDPDALEFETYQKSYGRSYDHGSDEYWHRRGLFEKRSAKVKEQNAKADRLWDAVAGIFADRTEAERSKMLGYRRNVQSPSFGGSELPAAVARERELLRPIQGNQTIPKEFNWLHLRQANAVQDQGSCGSCWAVTSKSVLDAHYEIHVAKEHGALRNFSAQQIVTCVPNPRDCGGSGGCSGSTVELAFDWVYKQGCANEHDVPYSATDSTAEEAKCNQSAVLSGGTGNQLISTGDAPDENGINAPAAMAGSAFGMYGWKKLEQNKDEPLMLALYHHGPVGTSTAAGPWFEYHSGVFNGCPTDTVVDHAVTLYGFGEADKPAKPEVNVVATGHTIGFSDSLSLNGALPKAEKVKYWLIRNSWGSSWGEKGFIRMERLGGLDKDKKEQHCGTDNDNFEGTGCEKPSADGKTPADSKNVTVCGMCGFLWDSVIPLFGTGSNSTSTSNSTSFVEVDESAKAKKVHLNIARREKY